MAIDLLLLISWRTSPAVRLLDQASARDVAQLLPIIGRQDRVWVLETAIVPTHAHTVLRIRHNTDLARVVQRLKGVSSRLLNRDARLPRRIGWAKGYDARSVGRRNLPEVRAYFDRQAERHGFGWVVRWSIGQPLNPALQGAPLAESVLQHAVRQDARQAVSVQQSPAERVTA